MDLSSLKIEYPELPVVEHREEFFEMLEKHQVVIVKADTGSGKSAAPTAVAMRTRERSSKCCPPG